ncbi:MAG: DUF6364 family protein [Bacteroidota bacterium]
MPSVNLTLRLDQKVIELGKRYAKEQGTSLSKLVEQHLLKLVEPVQEPIQVVEIPSHILALMGTPKSGPRQSSQELYAEYADYVASKHLSLEEE